MAGTPSPSTSRDGGSAAKRLFYGSEDPLEGPSGKCSSRKYSEKIGTGLSDSIKSSLKTFLPIETVTDTVIKLMEKRFGQTLATSSWKKYNSALNSFISFLNSKNKQLIWPLDKTWVH